MACEGNRCITQEVVREMFIIVWYAQTVVLVCGLNTCTPLSPTSVALGCIMYKLPEFLVSTLVITLPFSHIHSISPTLKLLNIFLVTKYDLHIYFRKNNMFVYEFDVEANLHFYNT